LNNGVGGLVGAIEKSLGCGSGAVEGNIAEFPSGERGAGCLIKVGFVPSLYQRYNLIRVGDGFPDSSLLGVDVVDGGEDCGEARGVAGINYASDFAADGAEIFSFQDVGTDFFLKGYVAAAFEINAAGEELFSFLSSFFPYFTDLGLDVGKE
jgi:hypothetical protein